jgi:hypothetical protein
MSRLDDELRLAFRRQEPPPDFVDRVLAGVATPPVAKATWWQTFLSLLHPPRARWVAIGFATALVVIIGSLQYQNVQQSDGSDQTAVTTPPPEVDPGKEIVKQPAPVAPKTVGPPKKPGRLLRSPVPSSRLAQNPKVEQERREGEAAKEQLILALHIASTTLNEAQKIIRED